MPEIGKEELQHIAKLARIILSGEEEEKFQGELSSILEYFSILDEIKTEVEPLHHVFDLVNIFREDREAPSFPREDILANTPEKEEGYVRGPRII
jgi:aspartyl-tRNA(Asn)/glutamyl-tRNA(Gln) amidotransferase subunit C